MEIILILLALICAIVVKHLFFWTPLDVNPLYKNGPLMIGHRGSLNEAPENTIPSFRKAVEAGLSAIEIDVIGTKDGKIVCSHNLDLENETDGSGYIYEKTYGEIKKVNAGVNSPGFSFTPIPLLEEVFDNIPKNIIVNIEVKANKFFEFWVIDQVVNFIRERNLFHRTIVSSFHPLLIWRVKHKDKRIVTAYLWDIEDVPNWLKKPRFINLVHPDILHPSVYLVNENTLRLARRKGLKVNVWVVNNRPAIDLLLKLGVDGIFSDYPHLMLKR